MLSKVSMSSPAVKVVLLLTVVWMLFDVQNRFLSAAGGEKVFAIPEYDSEAKFTQLNADESKLLIETFNKYMAADENDEANTASLDQQTSIEGSLLDNHILRLKAVLTDFTAGIELKTALIELKNTETNEVRIEKFNNNSVLLGRTVVIINNTQVVIKQLEDSSATELLLTMYKKD